MNEKKQTKKGFGFRARLSLMSFLPMLVMALVLTVAAGMTMEKGMQDKTLEGLRNLTISVRAGYDGIVNGDYSLGEDDNLYKGDFNVSEATNIIDGFVDGSDADVTIFFGDTRRATSLFSKETGERIIGTQASEEVTQKVVKAGEEFSATNLKINGQAYYAYYIPLKNSDGSVVGMVFAGIPSISINKYINKQMLEIIIIAFVIMAVGLLINLYSVEKMRKAVLSAEKAIVTLASGKLNIEIGEKQLKRTDEIGEMCRSTNRLADELKNTLGAIKDSIKVLAKESQDMGSNAKQTSETTDEVARACDDISKGAVTQAEEIETATMEIGHMGTLIEKTVAEVETLSATADDMQVSGEKSNVIMGELTDSNDKTMDAITRVSEQVKATDESVQQIQEAVNIITSIASQTSLLSLNASIEAARAGEAGKGFAVVATEIQKLAEQCNESAKSIEQVTTALSEDSKQTMETMGEVNAIVAKQLEKLDETQKQFKILLGGVEHTKTVADTIAGGTKESDDARAKVIDGIANLSAISEENAASTEQTTASMQELNATINLLAESADKLKGLAVDLAEDIEFFEF